MANDVIAYSRKMADKRAEHSGYHYLADCALIEGDCRKSLGLYRESLGLANAIGDRLETAFEIEGVAMSLAGLGEHEVAVHLAAAARAELARIGVSVSIRFWDVLVERYLTPARNTLGAERAGEAFRQGSAMSFEQAVAAALDASR